ncbi:hypothetical protein EIP75_21455 [Aquabacterium soli]|uniref:Uncharacterized protein n=1 Tax=Aquabacterium soli TaxID=2493092 RepID=A0A3R8TPZ7_9BURK|nr:hypothetical protein [Aquabacterium soli]RRS01148.1 hypothetical protein EIP75_21455 [Aquabacterium soli]
MRILFLSFIAVLVACIISDGLGHDADVKLAIHQSERQSALDSEQRSILSHLEAKHNETVSEFVRDWRRAYPAASETSLQELRLIEQKINNDVNAANQFTLAYHQKKADEVNGAIEAPFSLFDVKLEARPGM